MSRPTDSTRSPALAALRSSLQTIDAALASSRNLIALSAVVGRPVTNLDGSEVGRIVDAVARWQGDTYPPLTGLVVRIGRRRAFVAMANVASLSTEGAVLSSARLDLVDFVRRDGEVVLGGDVLDHQLVDVEGVQVIRASDLLVGQVGSAYRLVGVDVGVGSLIRRLGPRRLRTRPVLARAIDWSLIQPLGTSGDVRITMPNRELHRLRPGEIADLLEALGRTERQQLLDTLEGDTAADALEEMERDEVAAVLREAPVHDAARLLATMEPDEAVDALRDLDEGLRAALFAAMAARDVDRLQQLLRYRPDSAGGVMTTVVVTLTGDASVADARVRLQADAEHRLDIDAVIVVDTEGRVLDDVTMFELLVAEPDQRLLELAGEPWPVTVQPGMPLDDLVDALRENRRSSIVVVDEAGRPLGRVLADDLLDAVTSRSTHSVFGRIPS